MTGEQGKGRENERKTRRERVKERKNESLFTFESCTISREHSGGTAPVCTRYKIWSRVRGSGW